MFIISINNVLKFLRRRIKIMKVQLLQDPYLNEIRKEKISVSVFLVNGIKLQGLIVSFDQYVILLKSNVTQMVYKHAISTIVPTKDIDLNLDNRIN